MRCALWLLLPVLALSGISVRGDAPADVLAKAPAKFAKSGDHKVCYKSLGTGDTAVVFIHGWCCDHTVWSQQAVALQGKVRMLFIDLPGYGRSDKPKIDYTTSVFANGINAVLRDAGVERVVLVGHALGTAAARQFYRLFPGKTKAMVIVDGALKSFHDDPADAKDFLEMIKEDTFKQTSLRLFNGMMFEVPTTFQNEIRRMVESTDPKVAISTMRAALDPKSWPHDPIKVPTIALMATSPFWTAEYKEYAKKLVPGLDYREFSTLGTFLFLEQPKEFNAALMEFLKKQNVVN